MPLPANSPEAPHAHQRLGALYLKAKNDAAKGQARTQEAPGLNPGDGCAHFDPGRAVELARRKGQSALIQACESLAAQLEDAGAGL